MLPFTAGYFARNGLSAAQSEPSNPIVGPNKYTLYKQSQGNQFRHYNHTSVVKQQPYLANSYASIYNFPPSPTKPTVLAVISLGGGLYGSVARSGILTGGDVHAYWSSIGIPAASQPTVVVVPIDGAVNSPDVNDGGSTAENTLDVTTIGSCCYGSKVTILFYLTTGTVAGFYDAFNSAINVPVLVNGIRVSPSVISCSWGAPENSFTKTQLNQYNNLFAAAVAKRINICVASGDNGSSDGGRGNNADFPSSSPNVVSCGGTTLTCPSLNYTGAGTIEVAWSTGGGGLSAIFACPSYQAGLGYSKRALPDIAMNADPNTGINFLIGGQSATYGGTSIVAPAMAAFIACSGVTDFINPHLYKIRSNAACFHDITSGSNGAYSAKKGYDLCTGLGSLIGTVINKYL